MRKVKLLVALMLWFHLVSAQGNPVQWEFKAKKVSSENYEISIVAVIEGNWHIYSQFTPDGGPVATSINFNKNPLIAFNGHVKEIGKLQVKHEDVFDVQVKYFDGMVVFQQLISLKKKVKTKISGTVEYMVCDDKQCLPPKKVPFSISL